MAATSVVRWCVVVVLAAGCAAVSDDLDPPSADNDNNLLQQVVWKRCYRKLTPACLKLSLVRTVEMMSKDSTFHLFPGVYLSTNATETPYLPPEVARSLSSDLVPLDDLVAFSLRKYLRSLTVNLNLAEFVASGNKTLQNTIDSVTGRKKEGMGGYGAVAAMMGGMMATMMMAALAGLAGKALMTSLAALMMSGFAAMKGGGGGGETKTYEVITKPIVSHVNTHSAEVQHEHHGHYRKRSVDIGEGETLKMQSRALNGLRYRALEDRYGWRNNEPAEPRVVNTRDIVSDDMVRPGHPRLALGKFNGYEDDQSFWALGLLR